MFHNPPTKARRVALLAAVAVATLAVASRGRADLWIQSYAASRNDRFYSGADKAFIGQPYDWSGVGQQGGVYWATMISPEYFISANHYHPALGGTLTFYEDNTYNHPRTYTVDSSWSANDGDLFLGRLTAPIPAADHITYYPVLDLPNDADYVGREILVNGKPNRVGLNVITYAGTYMTYSYDTYGSPGSLGDEEAYIIAGDSGGPSFTDVNGIMAVLGTHYWNYGSPPVNGSVSGDSFVPDCIAWLDSQMVGEQVTVVTPEPGTLTLLAAAAACAVAVLVRRACV